jgi:hypothetical protein
MMPPWLKRHLEAIGAANTDGISRQARARICPGCRRPVMAGLDSNIGGFPTRCDPEPLNPLGELDTLMADRHTFELRWIGGGYRIDYRNADHMQARPAGQWTGGDVLAEHRCRHPPAGDHTTDSRIPDPTTPGASNDPPPF